VDETLLIILDILLIRKC